MFQSRNPVTLLSLVVPIVICLLSLPVHARYSGGAGEPNNPYQIATARDLIALGNEPNDYGKCFILTADIDLDPNLPGRKVFDKAPLAPDTDAATGSFEGTPFTGVLDGNGHTVSHLTITGKHFLGMFGQLGPEAAVKDLGMLDVKIAGSGSWIGGLAGANGDLSTKGGTVVKCHSTGSVSGTGWQIGGLVGYHGSGSIAMSFSSASVRGGSSVGGLVGHNYARITASYSTGSVIGGSPVGGLVGQNLGIVAASYSNGSVNGVSHIGGLVGENLGNIVTCYSTGSVHGESDVGGIVGYSRSPIEYVRTCVWDTESSGLRASVGGLGLTTAEMMAPNMLGLNGFAKDPNWVLDAGRDYPRLAWQATPGAIIAEPNIDWLEGQGTAQSPHEIDTADQLILLGKACILWDRHFVLGADINLDPCLPGRSIFPQALILVFTGVFDGNDHTISHLTIRGGSRLGLFGELGRWNAAGSVTRLRLEDVDIAGTGDFVGGLLGYTDSHDVYQASIVSCCSSGSVSGRSFVGGLVGHSSGRITASYSAGSVVGTSFIGGLAGSNSGSIAASYSTGSVAGTDRVGGLAGETWWGSTVTSYSTGSVSGIELVGGLVGNNRGATISACFWDTQTSGQTTSAGGTGESTVEMHTAQTFLDAGWDFVGETGNGTEDIWWIDEGKDYPRLWWEAGGGTP